MHGKRSKRLKAGLILMQKRIVQNEMVENELVAELLKMLQKQDLITEQELDRAIAILKSEK